MADDPYNPGPVRPIQQGPSDAPATYEDARPWWQRALRSLRPTADLEKDKKTGKLIGLVGVKGRIDF